MKLETGNNASIITFNGITPKIHPSVFTCEGVKIVGDVEIGEDSSVWYNTVIRGDVHYIRIGCRTNIQDLSMLHVTNDYFPLVVGNDVLVAHSVTLHGATIHGHCMIGMGARVLDGSVINSNSIVAAGAVIREGFTVPEGTLAAGVPAKIIRDLTEDEIGKISFGVENYIRYVKMYRSQIDI
ncbi:MAG: gamma carbonic anhydrase family protein [Ignavibacteria bacterium GWB2_35_12]|nr:MAG: gamma carbonic anhydrase family protein [Ignavibacteria bacterium GWA2_35_8]OGU41419.1 MAG: gamma carbonic anhydrase family protein [Ignavibacteria bacterium GWB2_35_12]OGV19405.1 MAG: gamma carbonic anhydrase family protein [Ignavibacteria bacterium RIFOXYC2_FULL_35_21]